MIYSAAMRIKTYNKCLWFFWLAVLLSMSNFVYAACCNTPCIDPYEGYNRQMYQFNKHLDCLLIKPLAILYRKIVPCPLVKGINNAFNNLGTITTIPNDILQGSVYFTALDTTRFIINSTFGIGGLFDVASCGGLPRHVEDTGLTFAKWGYCSSPYFVLPIIGPSTVRDTLGLPFDYYIFSIYPYIPYYQARLALFGLYGLDRRAQFLDFEDTINQASIDPYVFERDAYLQRRNFLIATNRDRCNNPNIQNENTEIVVATTTKGGDSDDIYVPEDAPAKGGDNDDIYVPEDAPINPAKKTR